MPKGWSGWIESQDPSKENVLLVFGNPLILREKINLGAVNTILMGYENNAIALDRAGQLLMGTYASQGRLPLTVNSIFRRGAGMRIKSGGRLKESQPEELGVSPNKLAEIDSIVAKSILAGAFPGCQIVVAVKGKVIYRKSFGHHTYKNDNEVTNNDVYDIASITKIASSTLSLMHMESNNKFNLDARLSDYLPQLTKGTPYRDIRLKAMMSHQAGLNLNLVYIN
jgi:hypothetical protein